MQFSGYRVSDKLTHFTLEHATFDETELTPESNWKEAWQNIDLDTGVWGYADFNAAIRQVTKLVAKLNKLEITDIEIDTILNSSFENAVNAEPSPKVALHSAVYKLATIDDVKMINFAFGKYVL